MDLVHGSQAQTDPRAECRLNSRTTVIEFGSDASYCTFPRIDELSEGS